MLVSLNWIRDFTKLENVSPKDFGERYTLATAEVEEVIESGAHLDQVKIAEIESFEKHPEADKLNLVTFSVGNGESKRVVCGAKNLRQGMKVAFAPIGCTLPIGFTLEPKKIRGILSEGMLCSEEELGLAEKSAGIMELPSDSKVGLTLAEFWNQERDVVLDIDNKSLTHRPDLWGHLGHAREVAAAFKLPFENKFDEEWNKRVREYLGDGPCPIKLNVEEDSACLGYYGLSVSNVTVKESPLWMKQRLEVVGLRPINNIVDISNYVMLELGNPLHIFDQELIVGEKVRVHRLEKNQSFETLDEIERELLNGDTVISDGEKPLILAGIMGGANSGVSEKTKNIFIEVANWKPSEIRTTSTRLGLRTDSSQRFEKSLDSGMLERTLFRTLELVLELCPDAKVEGNLIYGGPQWQNRKSLSIDISAEKICKVLGKEVPKEEVVDIFRRLDFNVLENGDSLKVDVPSYRATKDIECEDDLIEEIGRIVGYDNIAPSYYRGDIQPQKRTVKQKLHQSLRDSMVLSERALELNTYPLVGEALLSKCSWPNLAGDLKLLNSLSVDHDRMRPSIVPALLETASTSSKYYNEFRCFDIGRCYFRDKKEFSREENHLVVGFYSKSSNPFIDLVNSVDRVLTSASIPFNFQSKGQKHPNSVIDESWMGLHPHEFYHLRIMGKLHGTIFSVHPVMLKKFKIKGQYSIAVINLSSFEDRPLKDKRKYAPLATTQESRFDYTLEVQQSTTLAEVLDCLGRIKVKEVKSHTLVDEFVNEGHKYLTIRSIIFDPEKTMSGEVIKNAEKSILGQLEKGGFGLKKA